MAGPGGAGSGNVELTPSFSTVTCDMGYMCKLPMGYVYETTTGSRCGSCR